MNVGVRRANRWRVGAVALGLLLAAAAPADAATSVRTADGAVLTVEEVGGTGGAAVRSPRALAFTWQAATGTRAGLVTPTVDAAIDESPVLTLDPRSGGPVLIWSRHDGAAMKLAWARFEAGAWGETRFLTFGPGDDRAPALGTSTAGSYLFWRTDDGSVLYAPLDLGSGRLFAAPRALSIAGAGAHGDSAPAPQGGTDAPIIIPIDPPIPSTNGGTDAPIIIPIDPPIPRINGGTDAPIIIPIDPPIPRANGGTDVPIIIGTNGSTDAPIIIGTTGGSGSSSTQSLAVFSDRSCATQILLLGSPHSRVMLVVEFGDAGGVTPLGRFVIHPEIAREDAVSAAGSRYLEASCR